MSATTSAPTALLRIIAALEEESDALVNGQVESLAEASLRKAHWLEEIAQALRGLNAEQQQAWRTLVVRARELNDRNARLLAARLVSNRARLDVLTGFNSARGATYGADGRAQGAWRNTSAGSALA